MKVLALDISTKSTGYAVFDEGELVQSGCITATSASVLERIEKITKELEEKVDIDSIDKVIVEDPLPAFCGHNVAVYKALTYAQGSIAIMLHRHNRSLKMEFFTSSEWRAKCGIHTGRGIKRDSLKQLDIDFVKENYNKTVNDDEADAIGIGHAYCLGDKKKSAF